MQHLKRIPPQLFKWHTSINYFSSYRKLRIYKIGHFPKILTIWSGKRKKGSKTRKQAVKWLTRSGTGWRHGWDSKSGFLRHRLKVQSTVALAVRVWLQQCTAALPTKKRGADCQRAGVRKQTVNHFVCLWINLCIQHSAYQPFLPSSFPPRCRHLHDVTISSPNKCHFIANCGPRERKCVHFVLFIYIQGKNAGVIIPE